jgi:hypothetical protein
MPLPPPQSFLNHGLQSHQVRDLERVPRAGTRFLSVSSRTGSRSRVRFRASESGSRNGPPFPVSGCYDADRVVVEPITYILSPGHDCQVHTHEQKDIINCTELTMYPSTVEADSNRRHVLAMVPSAVGFISFPNFYISTTMSTSMNELLYKADTYIEQDQHAIHS